MTHAERQRSRRIRTNEQQSCELEIASRGQRYAKHCVGFFTEGLVLAFVDCSHVCQ